MKSPGLSARVSLLLVATLILTEIIIFVPAMTNFRLSWLNDRLAAAHTAALVFAASPSDMIPRQLAMNILDSVGSKTIAIKMHGAKRLLAVSDMPVMVDETIDMQDPSWINPVIDAARTLFANKSRLLNVKGPAPMGGDFIEIVIDEAPLQKAMRAAARTFLGISVLISGLLTLAAGLALRTMVLRPVRRLTNNLMRFAEDPEDATRIMAASGAGHEIGQAEIALQHMQTALFHELKNKKHLAALGLAVAKINHDLRNMLASAQLFSDRLGVLTDPQAQKTGARLIAALDRALAFCQSTLDYGRSSEGQPQPEFLILSDTIADVLETSGLTGRDTLTIHTDIPANLQVYADPEQLARILLNLLRNADEALRAMPSPSAETGRIGIRAGEQDQHVWIEICDNGPGIAPERREGLFEPFQGSSKAGGSGLGLPIAAELLQAHGGRILLQDNIQGACFRIILPVPALPAPRRDA